jgi:hypothetical protein
MSVACAHDICDRIEHALKEEMGEAVVTIHVEPEPHSLADLTVVQRAYFAYQWRTKNWIVHYDKRQDKS